jgi:predicted DNA-binding transcriptional regulator AlpA
MMSTEEVQALLPRGRSHVTVWNLVRSGELPPPRVIGGSKGWLSDEIYNAIRNLPRRIYKGSSVAATTTETTANATSTGEAT